MLTHKIKLSVKTIEMLSSSQLHELALLYLPEIFSLGRLQTGPSFPNAHWAYYIIGH